MDSAGGWCPVHEHDVAADAEGGQVLGDAHGVVEGRAGGHHGGRGQGAGRVEVGDGAIDALGKAEVVRVDDEAGGHGLGVGLRGGVFVLSKVPGVLGCSGCSCKCTEGVGLDGRQGQWQKQLQILFRNDNKKERYLHGQGRERERDRLP